MHFTHFQLQVAREREREREFSTYVFIDISLYGMSTSGLYVWFTLIYFIDMAYLYLC